jgi:hypothetical protein
MFALAWLPSGHVDLPKSVFPVLPGVRQGY